MKAIIFIDYWNIQLTLQNEDGRVAGLTGAQLNAYRFKIDWYNLGNNLVSLANSQLVDTLDGQLLQMHETRIYTSFEGSDLKYKNWANSMGRKPQIFVSCQERKVKNRTSCPTCHLDIVVCPNCKAALSGTQEKGVDTLIVTDLLRFGLDGTYDVAFLVSQDADMAPAAEHLTSKGIKVVHVGIRHFGKGISSKCWKSFNLFPHRDKIQRKTK